MPVKRQTSVLPSPNLLGAPARFDRWRESQAEAVLAALDSSKRFVMQSIPTGGGKSLACVMDAVLSDSRTMFLTSTKALQAQLRQDYAPIGMVEIRGMNSYECLEGMPSGRFGDMRREGYRVEHGMPMMCDEAPCQAGAFCVKRDGGCLYYDAVRLAGMPQSRLVLANYAYWMNINKFGEGLGSFDLLVLDEAHSAVDELGSFIGTELSPHEVESVLPGEARLLDPGADQSDWREWGSYWVAAVGRRLETIRNQIREWERASVSAGAGVAGGKHGGMSYAALRLARDLKRLQHKLSTISGMRGEWLVDWNEDSRGRPKVRFDPIWPGEYAEESLFCGIKKVILVSATARPKIGEMLGVPASNMDFQEYPSTFPVARRPIIFTPAGAMNIRMKGQNLRSWINLIDQIIDRRLDRKGIIHTVSYPRMEEIYRMSRHKERMLIHDSYTTKEVIWRFKQSRENLILVSPAVTTGYDFPYTEAEFQIIAKMPFPDSRDKIVKARNDRDKNYRNHITMQKLVQMAGRINRAEDDSGETFVVDSDFSWFINKYQELAPKWFLEAISTQQMLRPPLPKLVGVKV